jgi:hypothetical protein
MSEQVVVGNQVKLWYNTWGSYGQFSLALAILKDGAVVNPMFIKRPPRKEEATVLVGETEVRVVNDSSSKNARIYVYVPAEKVLAVVSTQTTSSGGKGWEIVDGEGDIEVKEEKREREESKNGRRFKIVESWWVYYFVTKDGKKVEFYRETAGRSEIPLDRPKVKLVKTANVIYVAGDTYEIRNTLKQLGFRWNDRWSRWEKANNGDDIKKLAEGLGKVADVTVEEGNRLEKVAQYLDMAFNELYKAYTELENTVDTVTLKAIASLMRDVEAAMITARQLAQRGETDG